MGSKPKVMVNQVITFFIILVTVAQMFVPIALGKALFRYFPMWMTFWSRFFFVLRLRGYPSTNHILIECTGAGLGFFMFIMFNLQKAYIINWMQFMIILVSEIVLLIIMFADRDMVYVISQKDVITVEQDSKINRGEY